MPPAPPSCSACGRLPRHQSDRNGGLFASAWPCSAGNRQSTGASAVRSQARGPGDAGSGARAAEDQRYWDAAPCAEFGLQMAQEALDKDLRGESEFLARFDRVYKAVNDAIDMNGNDLALLVRFAVQNSGQLSHNRVKQFIAKGHPQQLLNLAQQTISAAYERE